MQAAHWVGLRHRLAAIAEGVGRGRVVGYKLHVSANDNDLGDAGILASTRPHIAALDLGSNSVRLAIFEVDAAGGFQEVENVKRTLRLGGRLEPDGRLGEGALADL